jgi:hypothetical protein
MREGSVYQRADGRWYAKYTTVGALLNQLLEDIRGDVSRRTWLTREGVVRLHIKPSIGTK